MVQKYPFVIFLSLMLFYINCKKKEYNSDTTVPESIPLRPIDLAINEIGESLIKITWIDKSNNETGFKIERKTDQTSYVQIGVTKNDITTFIDSALSPNIKYFYRVYSFNNLGNSVTHSNEVSATTLLPQLPKLETKNASAITFYSALLEGNVTLNGQSSVIQRGFVYSKNLNPTLNNSNTTINGTGLGQYSQKIIGLESNTTYYFRTYAKNSYGTAYGLEFSFKTSVRPDSGIGSIGPGGGIVFYDKKSYGFDQNMGKSWRFLEVSGIPIPSSIGSVNVQFDWGCSPSSSGAIYSGIGSGIKNQNAIEQSCPSPFKTISNVKFYTWAAWVDSVNQKGYSDWYIPSLYEVQVAYSSLIIPGIMPMGGTLATSTEHDPSHFKVITINGGPGPDNSFGWTPKFIGNAANQWLMIRAF